MNSVETTECVDFKQILVAADSKLKSLPATAQSANQQGVYLASCLNSIAKGNYVDVGGFRYRHMGYMSIKIRISIIF